VDDKFTKIPNEYINGDNMMESNKLFLLMILLQGKTSKDVCFLSIKYLCKRLNTNTGNTNRTKYIIDTLKYFKEQKILCYSDTIDCEYDIDIEEATHKDKTDIFFAELYNDISGDFTIIADMEVKLIISLCQEQKIDKYNIIHLFLYILSCIKNNEQDEDYKLCYPSIDKISNVLGLSEITVLKYIKILKEEHILYYDSIGYKIINGQYKMTNTYYCRYKDKDKLDYFIEYKRKDKGIKPMTSKDKNITNIKRSLKQKINKLNKKDNKTEEEVLQLKKIEKEYETLKK
jgi:hypothetical protein